MSAVFPASLFTNAIIFNNRDFVKALIIKINAMIRCFEVILTSFSRIKMKFQFKVLFIIKKYNGTVSKIIKREKVQ